MALGINYNKDFITAGTKQFDTILYRYIQYKDSFIKNKTYWDNNSFNPITVIGGAIVTQTTANLPLAGEFVFNPASTQKPLVGKSFASTKIEAVVGGDGAKMPVTFDMGLDDLLALVVKGETAGITGKLQVKTDVTNYAEFAFTTGLAGEWDVLVVNIKDEADPNVTYTGTPDFTNITAIEITLDNTNTVYVASVYAVQDSNQIIGTTISIDYTTCPTGYSYTRNIETADVLCKQSVKDTISTGRTDDIELTHKTNSLMKMATTIGKSITMSKVMVSTEVYSTSQQSAPINAGTITLPSADNVSLFSVNGKVLQPTTSASLVDANHYFQSGTSVLVDAQYNGIVPKVSCDIESTVQNYNDGGLELGFVGRLEIKRVATNGQEINVVAKKARLISAETSEADDGDETTTKIKLLADEDGNVTNVSIA